MPEKVPATDLVPMDLFSSEPIQIDVVYAQGSHSENIFKAALYHKDARLSLHKDLAKIVIAAARHLHDNYGITLILKDGLRTYEAQAAMSDTPIVKDNLHWLEEPNRLVSPPGAGAHPRGVAIDVSLLRPDGIPVDMGTVFDEMTEQSARAYTGFKAEILENRRVLEETFVSQAQRLGLPMQPLSSEWWDFRYPRKDYEQWEPLHEHEVPAPLRLIHSAHDDTGEWQVRFDKNVKEVLNSL